jgi:putative ATPase
MDDDALLHLATTAMATRAGRSTRSKLPSSPRRRMRTDRFVITRAIAEESIQKKAVVYDADDDQHYDTISAFIKSIRGSDPDAALYWLAKMLYAGEDIRFIARRLVIARERRHRDGRSAGARGCGRGAAVGRVCRLPEAQIPLAHATVYLATAPKSNRAYIALTAAQKEVKEGVTLAVPRHLRSTGSKRAKKALGHEGYQYSHDFEDAYVPQAYLPEGRRYYEPGEQGYEKRVKERLDYWRALLSKRRVSGIRSKPSHKQAAVTLDRTAAIDSRGVMRATLDHVSVNIR